MKDAYARAADIDYFYTSRLRGRNLDQWVSSRDKSRARWTVLDGVMVVNKAAGNIETKRSFVDYQLHIEWRIPENITGTDQARGNSGVFLASTGGGDAGYELQILDSYNNKTYVNGQAGSVYKQYIPLVNASRKPGEWQACDVVWTAPRFKADGSLKKPAYVTAFHNGVLIQDHVELQGETVYIGKLIMRMLDQWRMKCLWRAMLNDLRYALRTLRQNPGFALTEVQVQTLPPDRLNERTLTHLWLLKLKRKGAAAQRV